MSRVGYIYFPEFLLSQIRRQQPHIGQRPLLLHRTGQVLAISPELRGRVAAGMRIKQASGRCPEAVAVEVPAGSTAEACQVWLSALKGVAAAVEPVSEEAAFFIPASFYGQPYRRTLQQSLRGLAMGGAVIGMSSTKMVSHLAAHTMLIPGRELKTIQYREVKAGGEAAFLQPFLLQQDIFLPLAVRHTLQVAGINTFAQVQQLTLADLVSLFGEQTYQVFLHCQGRDYQPVIGSYPPEQLAICFSCLPDEQIDSSRWERWLNQGTGILASRLRERNQGCRRMILSRDGIEAERILSVGRQEEKSLRHIFRLLAEQLGPLGDNEQMVMRLTDLYTLNWVEQDLFNPRQHKTENTQLGDMKESLEGKYPGAFTLACPLNRREEVLAERDPWRYRGLPELAKDDNNVCTFAYP